MHCYRSYRPRITLRAAIVAGIMSKKVAGKQKSFFSSNSVRLLMESSKEDEKMSVDDIVSFFNSFQCITCYQRLRDGTGPLRRPQRPRPAKRSGECDYDAVQVAVEGKILKSCAVAPSKTTITWKKWILPGITMKNLLSMARGSYTRVSVLCRQQK